MRRYALLGVLGMVLWLGGCSSPATVEGMSSLSSFGEAAAPSELHHAIELGTVTGGKPTNPLLTSDVGNAEFREALAQSLRAAGILATDGSPGAYLLEATLVGMSCRRWASTSASPPGRRSITGLADGWGSGKSLHNVVTRPYTATFSDALSGAEARTPRERGAIRENIREFIDQLIAFYSN
ncbi:MAG: hypothetical protein R3D25_10945 [Geminicoccaceae bacterium]